MAHDGGERMHRPRILVLDDEEQVRTVVGRVLAGAGYEHVAVGNLGSARRAIVELDFDLLLCDIQLVHESGLDLVREINRDLADIAIVMVTGEDDPSVASIAITLGAYGYLVKPFTPNEVLIQVDSALRRRELERVRRLYLDELESKVLDRSASLHSVVGTLGSEGPSAVGPIETADRLTMALQLRDEETGRHIERVGRTTVLLAQRAGLSPWPDDELLVAAMLHDVGKIAVPDLVLLKPGPLGPTEQATMRRHTEAGHRLLDGATARVLQLGASVALTHHERWDGAGYPAGLVGEEIPLEGRLTAIADAFDAMTNDRPYRSALAVDVALERMAAERGQQFDPDLLDAFLASIDDVLAIRTELSDTEPVPAPLRVLLVDDHTMFAETAVRLLDRVPGISVVGPVASVADALAGHASNPPDVIVTEWRLPDGTAADLARRVREIAPESVVVVLTDAYDDQVLLEAIDAGCAGCVGKHRPFDDLTSAIRTAAAGDALVPPRTLLSLLRRLRPNVVAIGGDLTSREIEVLGLLAEGLSSEAIAQRLSLSVHTVRNHSQRVLGKLGAHSRLEAVAAGVRAGLVARS